MAAVDTPHTQVEEHALVVVGAGPAGLSAALTAESEGIDTMVLDSGAELGGQAAKATNIENYAGFPDGISGPELISRIIDQASKYNTEFMAPVRVNTLSMVPEGILLGTDTKITYLGRAALLATGVEHRLLRVRNLAAYLGRGATYGTPELTAKLPEGEVYVIGGADSAGQAAVYLAEGNCNVHLVVRSKGLEPSMSAYLIDKIAQHPNIEVHNSSEPIGVDGNGQLEEITIKTGDVNQTLPASALYVLIGSEPKTAWLPEEVIRDRHGFVLSGVDLPAEVRDQFAATQRRQPFAHETSMPGLFVAGDARSGTDKRVALAVGDGAAMVAELHRLEIHRRLHRQ